VIALYVVVWVVLTTTRIAAGSACCAAAGELVRGRWLSQSSADADEVAGVVYALAMPFVGLVTAYVYFDARSRMELEPLSGDLAGDRDLVW
jgi:hypothetical protein